MKQISVSYFTNLKMTLTLVMPICILTKSFKNWNKRISTKLATITISTMTLVSTMNNHRRKKAKHKYRLKIRKIKRTSFRWRASHGHAMVPCWLLLMERLITLVGVNIRVSSQYGESLQEILIPSIQIKQLKQTTASQILNFIQQIHWYWQEEQWMVKSSFGTSIRKIKKQSNVHHWQMSISTENQFKKLFGSVMKQSSATLCNIIWSQFQWMARSFTGRIQKRTWHHQAKDTFLPDRKITK